MTLTNEPTEEALWRGDRKATFSDWKILVVTTTTTTPSEDDSAIAPNTVAETVYHVHKCMLACGPRRSEYFSRLFFHHSKKNSFQEGATCTSRIEVAPLVAQAFPVLLDYLYLPHNNKPLISLCEDCFWTMAPALWWLGDYLEVPTLIEDVMEACRQDMTVENVHLYYEQARAQQQHNNNNCEAILGLVEAFVARNITTIEPKIDTPILKVSDPQLWRQVARHVETAPKRSKEAVCGSCHLSKLIASYVTLHQERMDAATFQELTSRSTMPCISPECALELCQLDKHFHLPSLQARNDSSEHEGPAADEQQQQSSADDNAQPAPSNNTSLSPFQERCTSSLAKGWERLVPTLLLTTADRTKLCQQSSPAFLVDLLARCLQEAKAQVDMLRRAQQVLQGFRPLPPEGTRVIFRKRAGAVTVPPPDYNKSCQGSTQRTWSPGWTGSTLHHLTTAATTTTA